MVLRYEPYARLSGGHKRGIACIAFSPSGSLLATAGLDGKICVWDVQTSHLRYSFEGSSPALSLTWMSPNGDAMVCGLQDGNMAILKITATSISVTGFWAHERPVECLALKSGSNRLASGAHGELLIWAWDKGAAKYRLEEDVPDLKKKLPNDTDDEVLITSLHWTATTQNPDLLLVTFMHHGVLLLDAGNKWKRIRTVSMYGRIADASLSGDGMRLAVSNMIRGFDVYSMRTGAPLCTIQDKLGEPFPTPVKFVHGCLALLGGNTRGELHIWDVLDTVTGGPALNVPEDDEAEPRVIHTLQIPQREKALAIDAYYDEGKDEFLVAAGMMNETSPSDCIIWRAGEQAGGGRMSRTCTLRCGILGLTLIACVVAAFAVTLEYWVEGEV